MLVEIEAYDENDKASERLINFVESIGDLIEDGVIA